jgi:hypothetical protein
MPVLSKKCAECAKLESEDVLDDPPFDRDYECGAGHDLIGKGSRNVCPDRKLRDKEVP